jgi:hypothetical protein
MEKPLWYAIQQWRRERTLANESGHKPQLCYDGEKDGHFQLPPEVEEGLVEPWYPEAKDQEITLWQDKDF